MSGGMYGDIDWPISQFCIGGIFILPGDIALHVFLRSTSSSTWEIKNSHVSSTRNPYIHVTSETLTYLDIKGIDFGRLPIRHRIDGYLISVRMIQNTQNILVDFQRFENGLLVTDRTSPRRFITIHLQVGFQIETSNVLALVSSSRYYNFLLRDWTF